MSTGPARALAMALLLSAAMLAGLAPAPAAAPEALCIACIGIRTGPPMVVRGPFPDELDNHFAALRLPDGSFRGFTANGATYAVDGPDIRAMAGPRRVVLEPGPPGSPAECGRGLNGVVRAGGRLYGLVHLESGCDYDRGETHKAMAIAVSDDDGLTWADLGLVLTGTDRPTQGTITGEGDCTMTPGGDGFLYAYCLRNRDWQTIVARAPADDPRPGAWRKYRDGRFDGDALGGEATAIGFLGTGSGYLPDLGRVATVTVDPWFKGLRLSLSADRVTFADLPDPLLPIDAAEWQRPADTGLIAYAGFVNPADGTNVLGRNFLLAYVYVPPGKDFADRYLVLQEVRLSVGPSPAAARAGIAVARWNAGRLSRSGTLPVVDPAWRLDATLGFLLTRGGDDVVALEECTGDRAGRADHRLAVDGTCAGAGYTRLGTAGFAYAEPRPGTRPLYRCLDRTAATHFASNAEDCEGLGEPEFRLGYVLGE